MPLDWRAQVGAAALLVVLAALAAIRRRLRKGKRVFPRVRLRTYLSIRTPESEPPKELDAADVEIIDSSSLDEFESRPTDRPTPDTKRRRRRP